MRKKSLFQVVIRFHVQRGVSVIPKSVNQGRIKENFDVFDFTLSDDEMDQLVGLDRGHRLVPMKEIIDHPHFPFNEEF